ncbi:succinate dehydrogenase assembly factor 2 [Xanthobacter dioxanivorans]|uniref:FAD assembly factor SdhE n=1 Tax=Xanthobacter dioxanivorans TaxID=2528964 RepID=A0A974PKV7_9HYPH|nr:succinate dehydrogenase assembly factor 2 [Xanthobacter dioxanivorans]QRG05399.1 succinate dehydrogenase assembly factor 2 [Xanthobacter dioxanivorans]
MSGLTRSSDGLDERRRRILFRAWHRGMREMDLILGNFANAEIETLSDPDLDAFEELLEPEDQTVFSWISGTEPIPPEYDTPLFAQIRAFHLSGRGLPD